MATNFTDLVTKIEALERTVREQEERLCSLEGRLEGPIVEQYRMDDEQRLSFQSALDQHNALVPGDLEIVDVPKVTP